MDQGSPVPAPPPTLPGDALPAPPTPPLAGGWRCLVCSRHSGWLLPPSWRRRGVSREPPMITPEQRAEIRRLYYAEHWKVGTIATQLGVHYETVLAAINRASVLTRGGRCRATTLDPYLPFLRDTLAQYPRRRATRLHEMLRQRGYPGSAVQVRRAVRRLRPHRRARRICGLPPCPARSPKWTGAASGRSASAGASGRSRRSSWSWATRARCMRSSRSTRRSRVSSAATLRRSRPWRAVPGPSCTTI
jgi:hypothetical protein